MPVCADERLIGIQRISMDFGKVPNAAKLFSCTSFFCTKNVSKTGAGPSPKFDFVGARRAHSMVVLLTARNTTCVPALSVQCRFLTLQMKVKTNIQIKIFHSENTSQETIRANANKLSINLSRLDSPWAITLDSGSSALTAYCYKTPCEAVVVPTLPGTTDTRYSTETRTVSLPGALITSDRI